MYTICKCCGDSLHQSEFPHVGEFTHEDALIKRYGDMPCRTCSDWHVTCYATGAAIHIDDAYVADDGEYFASEKLAFDGE